jgi:polyhydroxyalkanoate synthase
MRGFLWHTLGRQEQNPLDTLRVDNCWPARPRTVGQTLEPLGNVPLLPLVDSRATDVEGLGNLPGDLANILYLLVSPVATATKYIQFLEGIENPKFVSTFLRMEKWIFDSPDMAGEFFREWIRDFLQQNLLIKNRLILDGQKVDLRKIKCPLLNVFGKKDYLAPPSTAKPLSRAVGSRDVTTMGVDTGHVGIFVGSKSYKTISPKIAKWIRER